VFIRDGVCFHNQSSGSLCLPWTYSISVVVLLLAVMCLAIAPLALSSLRTPTPSRAAARANRHAAFGSLTAAMLFVALLAVFGIATAVAPIASDGRALATLPAVAGLCLALTQAICQVTWPRPSGVRREAEIIRRTRADVLPRLSHNLLLTWFLGLCIALSVTSLLASGPRTIGDGEASMPPWSPYPGSYYATPMAVSAALLLIATELVVRQIVARPAVPGVPRHWDLHLRRRSARHLVAGTQLAMATTLASVLVLAGLGHRNLGQAPTSAAAFIAAAVVILVAIASLVPTIWTRGRTANTPQEATVR
jgi:hypothetical protein